MMDTEHYNYLLQTTYHQSANAKWQFQESLNCTKNK